MGAEREQWDDGNNFLAVAPGVIPGYERNVTTNTYLTDQGIRVIPVVGEELVGSGSQARQLHRAGPFNALLNGLTEGETS